MKKAGVKTVGFLGYTDAYGELWLKELTAQGEKAGIKVIATERLARSDTSVTPQALKLVSANPDAILVVISLIFALSAIGAYAVVYYLLVATEVEEKINSAKAWIRSVNALLGPLFVLIVSNLEGFLEGLHAKGLFWSKNSTGVLNSHFGPGWI